MPLYKDSYLECRDDELVISWYYFPYGAKHIAYKTIRSFDSFPLSFFRGRARIWGTGSFAYWANLDPGRPKKSVGLILDIGKAIKPFITPDDPDALLEALSQKTGHEPGKRDAPFI